MDSPRTPLDEALANDDVWVLAEYKGIIDARLQALGYEPPPPLDEARELLQELLWRAEAAAKEGSDEVSWPFLDETRQAVARLQSTDPSLSPDQEPRA